MRDAFLVTTPTHSALRAINYPRERDSFLRPKRGQFRVTPLRSMLSKFAESYWSVFTRLDCEPEFGVELVSQTDMFAAEPEGRVIRRDSMPKPHDHEVSRWQILIAGAGQMGEGNLFGRSIIADARLVGTYLGPHAAGLTFDEPGGAANLWTYAYLNSGPGIRAVRACAFGTSVPGLRLDLLGALPIPVPEDTTLLNHVAALVRTAVEERERYLRELKSARAIVGALPEMQEAGAACASRRARAIMWSGSLRTLCAWNAASVGSALALLQRSWRGRLADVVRDDGIYYGPRFARVACEAPHGLDFMSQRDVFLMRPAPRRIAHPGFADRKLFVPRDTLLIGAQGTLGEGEIFGRAVLVRGAMERMAYTQHLLRVIPKDDFGPPLFAFLSSVVGMRLLRSTAVGTKLLSMREDLLRELPVPELSAKSRRLVHQGVCSAFEAREAADLAEAEAIRTLQEQVLPAWLA